MVSKTCNNLNSPNKVFFHETLSEINEALIALECLYKGLILLGFVRFYAEIRSLWTNILVGKEKLIHLF